jgi:putative ABC transport system substrate-binding protein
MRRREFITLLGGAAAAPVFAPHVARAQQMPVIGFLNGGTAAQWRHLVEAYHKGLDQVDYVEGQNVKIEYRWAEGQWDRLPILAADLVQRQVSVIATGGGDLPALAAKAATSTIPIVYTSGGDPIKSGLVASLNRPGGNVTGITSFTSILGPKLLNILSELVRAPLIGVLVNSNDPPAMVELEMVRSAARAQNQRLLVLTANTENEIDGAFTRLAEERAGALFVGAGAYFTTRRDQLVRLAAEHAIPTIYQQREFVETGGLIGYGISFTDQYRQLGVYTGRVLNGAKPADLPVQQPTKFELVINLKSAKALTLEISPTLLAIADEVIE